ncbi:MAG TPA: hypothetical protein ENN51_07230 [candidate division WOR-3 bacterium]|uniref:Uncharacterized protein n=1 Tax=candidate division WOR-3 bacterium TaxID=2052148 RepID=A0A7V0XFV9_UNCW3|nr:hypothetical protein [candidate division WOR-3 bacterium]
MTRVSNLAELKQAGKLNAAEILIADEELARKMRAWQVIRTVANILVIVILAIAIFAWANPLGIPLLETGGFRVARQVMLAVGIGLLFLEYLLPGTRVFKIAGDEPEGLRLVNRRK